MCVNMPMLQILFVILTVKCVVSDSFTEPENNRTDLAFKSKIHTNAVCTAINCISNYCVGRSDDPSDLVKILKASLLENECKITTSFPDKGNNLNGYVTYNDNNQLNCSVNYTVDPSEISTYTLTFWVYNNCTSSSNCSFTLSSTTDTVVKFVGRTVSVKTQEFNSSTVGWIFVVLRKSNQISTVFINDRDQTTSELPSTLKQLTIQPTSIVSEQVFSLVDVRLFKNILTNREINQIYTNSAKLDDVYPHSECRCPETHPKINTTESYYSLQCENENGGLTNRFKTDSVVEYIIDNNKNTGWKTSQENVMLTIQLEAKYQIDEIEVIMKTTPCNVTLKLDSGHQKIFMNNNDVKWMNITNSIQKRSQLLNVVTRNITVLISGFCSTSISNHQIAEILITGRCNCHGNAGSCTYQPDSYTCSCTSNTMGSDCGTCTTKYYRQTKDFGCSYMCQCNTMGTNNTAQTCDEIEGQCQCKGNVEGRTCDTCKHLHYNLSSSNSNGCTRSPCYENGTTHCSDNATCATCVCKTNVKGADCNECEQNHYGINVLADGCVPCQCNISGTLNRNLSCNLTTGQCNCKLQVEGRKCNQCKDGYYRLSGDNTDGCLKCLCNIHGSGNKSCDHNTGHCHCVEERTNRQCDPYIESIVPAYGPQSGGTIVTVTGQLLGTVGISFEIYEDSAQPYNITSLNQTEVVFITKESSSTTSIQLTFNWRQPYYEDNVDKQEKKYFNFKNNPEINQVYPTASFKSGGCDVKFTGSSLDSVYKPYLKSYIAGTIKITDCRHVGTTTMICQSPVLVGYSDTSYTYGLFLDGVTSYENLTGQFNDKATVKLTDDPNVTAKEYEDYKMLFSDTITIQGSRLKEACEDNLNVAVGNVNCVIQSVNNEQIVCKPDLSFPGINQDSSDVMVTIGNFKKSAGRIKLILFWKTMEFIGITIGVCVLVIIIFVIVICCFRRRHRKNYDSSSTNKNKAQNGFDLPIKKEETLRFSNRFYSKNLEIALSHDETDHSEDFLLKLESSVREKIQKSVSDRKNIEPEKVCIFKGTEIRVINGKFSQDSANAGKELTIKTNVKTLKDLLNDRKYPTWMNNGLMECIKLQDCFHDNILRSLGISIDQNRFYVLYPLSTRGFKEYLNDAKNDFSIRELLEMCVQVAQGMIYLSNENMVHKDLATRNCVVMPDGTVKISDSSFSWNLYPIEYMYDEQRHRYLPIRWMALECLEMGYYDISSDVWSYGILLWEVMTLSLFLPYHDQESDASIKNHIDEGFRLGKPTNAPDELYSLMVNCWEAKNQHRPSFEDIVTELNEVMNPESVYINLDSTVKGKINDMPSSVPHRGASVNRGYQS